MYNISAHQRYFGRMKPATAGDIRIGDIVYFSYDAVYRHVLVLNTGWDKFLHAVRLDHLSRKDIQRIVEMIWGGAPSKQVYTRAIKGYLENRDGYRTYHPREIRNMSMVEYDYWDIERPLFLYETFYYNKYFGKQGALLIGYSDQNIPLEGILNSSKKVLGYPVKVVLELQQKLVRSNIWYNSDVAPPVMLEYMKQYELSTSKLRQWSFNDDKVKKTAKMIKKKDNTVETEHELKVSTFISLAKRSGGIFFVPKEYLRSEDFSAIARFLLFTKTP